MYHHYYRYLVLLPIMLSVLSVRAVLAVLSVFGVAESFSKVSAPRPPTLCMAFNEGNFHFFVFFVC